MEEGKVPSSNFTRKGKLRRSLASLEMTGYENHFCLWGKVGKGLFPLSIE
jgi:hypothetical protein